MGDSSKDSIWKPFISDLSESIFKRRSSIREKKTEIYYTFLEYFPVEVSIMPSDFIREDTPGTDIQTMKELLEANQRKYEEYISRYRSGTSAEQRHVLKQSRHTSLYEIEAKLSEYCHLNERMAQYIEEYQSITLRLQAFKNLPEYKLFLVYASIGVLESLETFMVAYENAYNTSPGAYRNGRIMINELISNVISEVKKELTKII